MTGLELSTCGPIIKTAYEGEENTNAFTDAEKELLSNQSNINTGDQDLSGKEDAGTAAELLGIHEEDHPVPTERDTRNEIKRGPEDFYLTGPEKTKLSETEIFTREEKTLLSNQQGINTGDQDLSAKENSGVAAGLMQAHITNHPLPHSRDPRSEVKKNADDFYVTGAEKSRVGDLATGKKAFITETVTSIAADLTLLDLIPAGYMLASILVEKTEGGALIFNVGTSAGGTDILYREALNGTDSRLLIFNRLFSTSAPKTLNINSPNWGISKINAVINITSLTA